MEAKGLRVTPALPLRYNNWQVPYLMTTHCSHLEWRSLIKGNSNHNEGKLLGNQPDTGRCSRARAIRDSQRALLTLSPLAQATGVLQLRGYMSWLSECHSRD